MILTLSFKKHIRNDHAVLFFLKDDLQQTRFSFIFLYTKTPLSD